MRHAYPAAPTLRLPWPVLLAGAQRVSLLDQVKRAHLRRALTRGPVAANGARLAPPKIRAIARISGASATPRAPRTARRSMQVF
jgi:hypothetical protein